MTDPLRGFLEAIIRRSIPKSWKVQILEDKNIIGIDSKALNMGWGIGWSLDGQSLKIWCGTTNFTVNLADPKSKRQLSHFFRYLTDWTYRNGKARSKPPKGLVIERRTVEDEE